MTQTRFTVLNVVLNLLLDLTQQAVRFSFKTDQWDSLAVYDADGCTAFIPDGDTA
ncbi:hypothetical protein [Streptomyces sp. NPDC057253]|uniref:hypothetical protein n=1 Tax=Streptomyces sp. NPDC057253 TaxID=3346069 RepID=UPI003643BAE8